MYSSPWQTPAKRHPNLKAREKQKEKQSPSSGQTTRWSFYSTLLKCTKSPKQASKLTGSHSKILAPFFVCYYTRYKILPPCASAPRTHLKSSSFRRASPETFQVRSSEVLKASKYLATFWSIPYYLFERTWKPPFSVSVHLECISWI